jgi:hypothetical protein
MVEQLKKEYKIRLLCGKVKDALSAPGTTLPRPTVKFDLLSEEVKIFLGYIVEMRRDNGGLLKPGAYASFRSSLMYLFFRYKYDVPSRYKKELKNAMEGVKRYTNTAMQAGEAALGAVQTVPQVVLSRRRRGWNICSLLLQVDLQFGLPRQQHQPNLHQAHAVG